MSKSNLDFKNIKRNGLKINRLAGFNILIGFRNILLYKII